MTRLILGLALLAGTLGHAQSAPMTKEVYISIHDVFIPENQKPNGDSFVVVSGMFPNSCYRWNRAQVTPLSDKVHEVRLVATVSQTMCLMVMVPFSKEVVIGQLSRGEHTLRFLNGDETYTERTLTIP